MYKRYICVYVHIFPCIHIHVSIFWYPSPIVVFGSAAKSLKSVANGGRDSICAASYLLLINANQLIVSFCTITATGQVVHAVWKINIQLSVLGIFWFGNFC